jgi:trans-aconitate methyltransferase
MSNPWLSIPLEDYERHMSLPAVGQAQMIADQFDRALARTAPASVAVIGCAGGNGFDRIRGRAITQVVAVDVNPDYLEQARIRHARCLAGLELICADVQSQSLAYGPVDFTYAALLFEYVEVSSTLNTLKRNSRPDAVLTTVLQLPHSTIPAVSSSPYWSLTSLASAMTLVEPETLAHAAAQAGFAAVDSTMIELASGKRFCVQSFSLGQGNKPAPWRVLPG